MAVGRRVFLAYHIRGVCRRLRLEGDVCLSLRCLSVRCRLAGADVLREVLAGEGVPGGDQVRRRALEHDLPAWWPGTAIAPSASDLESSKSWVRSISETLPRPSQRGQAPAGRLKL